MPAVEVYNSVIGGAFFTRLLEEWDAAGWSSRCFSQVSEADYRRTRTLSGRINLRWRMYGGMVFSATRAVRHRHAEGVLRVATTNPFYLPALVSGFARGRGATVNLVYDLFPDALIQAGTIRPMSLAAKFGRAVTQRAFKKCEATVFLGDKLRDHAQKLYGPVRRSVVIPVGADAALFRQSPPMSAEAERPITVMYVGNMGRMHDIDTIETLLKRGIPTGIRMAFHANGSGYNELKRRVSQSERLMLGGSLPQEQWVAAMKASEIGLVTIARGAEGIVMPSKAYSALVAGQALVAVCDRNSDLANLILEHDCGWVVEPGDGEGLARILEDVTRNAMILHRKRSNAFRVGHAVFDAKVLARQWIQLFESLIPHG
jgi:glycosyltransferase involved in cell wall biosynthesis